MVYTGIFPVCQDVDGLATVLAHEAAHVLARHGAERVSKALFVLPFAMLLSGALGLPMGVKETRSKKREVFFYLDRL